mmetsp:Transcript_17075/g.49021  ORF Transcript_17075/g.49021 Transcript_17075/m.49021 type:complete len:259 (-) Transcript_17075:56-832(-)
MWSPVLQLVRREGAVPAQDVPVSHLRDARETRHPVYPDAGRCAMREGHVVAPTSSEGVQQGRVRLPLPARVQQLPRDGGGHRLQHRQRRAQRGGHEGQGQGRGGGQQVPDRHSAVAAGRRGAVDRRPDRGRAEGGGPPEEGVPGHREGHCHDQAQDQAGVDRSDARGEGGGVGGSPAGPDDGLPQRAEAAAAGPGGAGGGRIARAEGSGAERGAGPGEEDRPGAVPEATGGGRGHRSRPTGNRGAELAVHGVLIVLIS